MTDMVVRTGTGMFVGVGREEQPIARGLRKAHRAARREALRIVGETWVEQIAPKHFTNAGAAEYKYTPRSGDKFSGKEFTRSYQGRKLKTLGHTRPLEKSGKSKRRVMQSRARVVKDTVRIVINAPALNFRNPFSSINMREEITAVSSADVRLMSDTFEREFGARFSNNQ